MGQSTITINTILKQSDNILMQTLDDDIIMADINTGNYFGLDLTGRRIWELIEQPAKLEDICARLAQEYEVDPASCEQEVVVFVNELVEKGLIQVVE